MPGNSFGKIFKFSTWGESHGPAIGCTIDGIPSKIKIKEKNQCSSIHAVFKIINFYL